MNLGASWITVLWLVVWLAAVIALVALLVRWAGRSSRRRRK